MARLIEKFEREHEGNAQLGRQMLIAASIVIAILMGIFALAW